MAIQTRSKAVFSLATLLCAVLMIAVLSMTGCMCAESTPIDQELADEAVASYNVVAKDMKLLDSWLEQASQGEGAWVTDWDLERKSIESTRDAHRELLLRLQESAKAANAE